MTGVPEATAPAPAPVKRHVLRWRPSAAWAAAAALVFVLGVLHLSRISEFIYYQF